jgi:menaquinol-cytochrome c reductase iron-sulfur subunit
MSTPDFAETEATEISRRSFLSKAVAVLASFIGGAIAVPAIGHIVSPALQPPETPLIAAGSVDEFEIGKPKKVDFFYYKRDGWIEERTTGSAWVVRRSEAEFVVFNPRCTHLGCPYSWNADRAQFVCPCHDGIFSAEGAVVSGPAPRSLDRFEHAVEGGKLFIKEASKHA